MISERGFEGGAARSISTSHLIDQVGKAHGREVEEVPVGFKYIGKQLAEGAIAMGGEESGGMSIRGHVPEKDGILACLLVCEMRARRGKSLQALLEDLWERVGKRVSSRLNIPFMAPQRAAIEARLADPPKTLAGRAVERVSDRGGLKLYLENEAWFMVRLSGTEPMVRLYAESHDEKDLAKIIEAGRKFLLGSLV